MSSMVLFTHLKIILLQCFQFSTISKRTLSIQRGMDLIVSTNSQCNESIIALITIVKN